MSLRTTISRFPISRQGIFPRHWFAQMTSHISGLPGWFSSRSLEINQKNARYLQTEIFWSSILSAAASFNAAFALRLGATNQEVGLLTSLPALLALLVTIPSGHYFSRHSRWMPLILRSLFAYRVGFLVVALLPWLPFPGKETALIWILIGFTLPAHFFAVGWSSMLAQAIPEVDRARVFAMRNGVSAIALTGGIFLAGLWLEMAPFPISYQALYSVGFLTSLVSLYYIGKIQLADAPLPQSMNSGQPHPAIWARLRSALAPGGIFRQEKDFVRMVVNTFAHGLGLWMIGPLYVLYFVRQLGANEGWLGLNGMLTNLTPVLGFYLWQRATVRWGENRVLKWTITICGLYPVLVGATSSLTWILVWTALNGLLVPGITLSHFPMLLKVCPDEARPLFMGVYTSIMNVGAFVMPLIGVFLASIFGLEPVLMGGGLLCLLGSALFVLNPLQTPDSLLVRQHSRPESQQRVLEGAAAG